VDPVKVFLEQEFLIFKTGKVGRIIEYNAPSPPPPTRPQQSGKTVKDLDHALNYETCLRTTIRQRPFSCFTLLFLLIYLCKSFQFGHSKGFLKFNLIGLKGLCHVTNCATQLLHTVPLYNAVETGNNLHTRQLDYD
jgi:hypothetical protein